MTGPTFEQEHGRVGSRPRLERYLASERRLPWSDQDVFRHYPELDP